VCGYEFDLPWPMEKDGIERCEGSLADEYRLIERVTF